MGLDYGSRRVGVALSDTLGLTAQPYGVIDRRGQDLDTELGRIVEEMDVDRIVVGWPVSLSGEEGPAAREVRGFAQALAESLGLPVELSDERLTTVTAEVALREGGLKGHRRRRVVDKVAAAVMLQGYLDRC